MRNVLTPTKDSGAEGIAPSASDYGPPRPLQGKSLKQIIQLQLSRLAPVEDRLDNVWSKQSQPQNPAYVGRLHALRPGQISSVAYKPSSSIRRQRNARPSACTMPLSTHGRGTHSAPSGVATSFRPPRLAELDPRMYDDRWFHRKARRFPLARHGGTCRER
jgi:hypothetical protein